MPRTRPIMAWHFLPDTGRTRYDNKLVVIGKQMRFNGSLVMCDAGLHASRLAIDALQYAPGNIVCRVAISGTIIEDKKKMCASRRTVLAMADATATLHEFACRCAESALHHIPERQRDVFIASISAKRAWLRGEIDNQALAAELDAAKYAATSAAMSAAMVAAKAAAKDAARSAAWNAARAAAWSAGWSATGTDAKDAAWSAARSDLNSILEQMLTDLLAIQ